MTSRYCDVTKSKMATLNFYGHFVNHCCSESCVVVSTSYIKGNGLWPSHFYLGCKMWFLWAIPTVVNWKLLKNNPFPRIDYVTVTLENDVMITTEIWVHTYVRRCPHAISMNVHLCGGFTCLPEIGSDLKNKPSWPFPFQRHFYRRGDIFMVQIKGKRCGNFRVIERLFLSEGPETRLMRQEAAIFGHSKGFCLLDNF